MTKNWTHSPSPTKPPFAHKALIHLQTKREKGKKKEIPFIETAFVNSPKQHGFFSHKIWSRKSQTQKYPTKLVKEYTMISKSYGNLIEKTIQMS